MKWWMTYRLLSWYRDSIFGLWVMTCIWLCHVLALLSLWHHSAKYSGKRHLIMLPVFLLNIQWVRIIWILMNFLLCQNGIVYFCLNNAQDNEGLAVWGGGSFCNIIHNSFNVKDIHQVSLSTDILIDIILWCLHWWRKQKKTTEHIFVYSLQCQWSLSVIKPGEFQDYPGASQVRAYRAEGLITQLKFHCPPVPEISFQKERIWGALLPIFFQFFILFWVSPLISTVSSVFLYHVPSLLQIKWRACVELMEDLRYEDGKDLAGSIHIIYCNGW